MGRKKSPAVYWTESDVVELRRTIDGLIKYAELANEEFRKLNQRVAALEARSSSNTVGYS